jgi:5'-deoxynucleotidase YfbR-like HD superfamily hydrolase
MDTVHKIMDDDDFVKDEIEKILLYFNLKHTIRYGHSRNTQKEYYESVAEHVYGMHILTNYFLPLYANEHIDRQFVYTLINWHDMAEAVVGDMTSELKTKEHIDAELVAEEQILNMVTPHLSEVVGRCFREYHELVSLEAQFVRAIDKLEPLFHLLLLARKCGKAPFKIGSTVEEDKVYRGKSISKFHLLQRFDDIISVELATYDYFKHGDA